jgi:cobalt-zinc-cadmium efflux system outer membrane protein
MSPFVRVHASAPWLIAGLLFLANASVWAQPAAMPASPSPLPAVRTLSQAFEAAWAAQPPAASRASRTDAALAAQRAAATWTAGPPAAGVTTRTDRIGSGAGAREFDIGLSAPVWLPGERERAGKLADTQLAAVDARIAAARLRLAAAVRDSWWTLQRAELEHALAGDRLDSARGLNADVLKRLRAGELSRADQFQAEGAVAQAEVALAESEAARSTARQALAALVGTATRTSAGLSPGAEPEPLDGRPAEPPDARHPALAELSLLSEQSRRVADLASVQRRANPEVGVTAVTERGAFGERYANSLMLSVRIPLDAGPRADNRIATARAESDELDAQLVVERNRITAETEAARARLIAARERLAAAERRAVLARDVRGFVEKSFRLGESDLPTRLRVEIEAVEAQRQAAVARIAVAGAVSALRQALGLLPE